MRIFSSATPCRVVRGCVPLAALLLAATAAIGQGARVHAPVTGVTDLGPIAGGQQVAATVYLQPDATRVAALNTFLHDVEQPGTAAYHQWVTPAQFAAKFGPTDAQVSRVDSALTAAGLRVDSVDGLRMTVSGPAGLLEAAFAPGLHTAQAGGAKYITATQAAQAPSALRSDVLLVGGMTTLPEAHPLSLSADGLAVAPGGLGSLQDLAGVVGAGSARVLAVHGAACASEFADGEQAAVKAELRQAEAEGITVLAEAGCGTAGDASFPAALESATAIVPVTRVSGALAGEVRPSWQSATGLPANALRYAPDAVVTGGVDALAVALEQVLATMKPTADGSAARLGPLGPVLYELAAEPGLFTQADGARAGTWEQGSGLGTLDLQKLAELYPRGSLATYIQVNTDPLFATHGAAVTFLTQIKDISGNGTAAPSGTVTFKTDTGNYTLGTATLTANGATSSTAQVTYNQLPAGSYNVIVSYSGDASYAANSNQTYFTIGPEESVLTATFPKSVALGAMIPIVITDTAASGVGAPNVKGYIIPQGIASPPTYSVQLTPNADGKSSSGTVNVPATNAGTMTLLLGCTSSDASFTCYNTSDIQVAVGKSTPTATLSVQPTTLVSGLPAILTMTVTGVAGQATPTGTVNFFDNGTQVGTTTLDASGKATYTTPTLTSATGHAYTATYYGDDNYTQVSATGNSSAGTSASTTTLTVSPTLPVKGQTTTLTTTVAAATGATSSATPTGTVTIVMDGTTTLGSATLNSAGVGTVAVTTIDGTTAHSYKATYSGDTNYLASSGTAATAASGTGSVASTVTVAASANTVVSGGSLVLTATVASGSSSSTAVPTGTVTFTSSTQGALGTATLNSAGVAVLAPVFTTTGASTITATYAGNTTYAAGTSTTPAAVTVTAAAVGTTASVTTIGSSSNTVATGGTVTFTALVSSGSSSSTAVPTGTVTFTSSTQGALGTATLNSAGVAVLTSTFTTAGAQTITASYGGNAVYAASTTATGASLNVTTTGTAIATTTLTSSAATVATGGSVVLTATVSASSKTNTRDGVLNPHATAVPTGTVTFTSSTQGVLGSATLNAAGVAVLAPVLTTPGASTLSATYSGDSNYATAATATATPLQVGPSASTVASTTTIVSSASTVAKGGTTTLTATVASGSSSSTAVPTGTVTFTSSTQGVLGTATLNAAGVAVLAPVLTTAGASTISAAYGGDTTYTASTSASPAAVTVSGTTTGTVPATVAIASSTPTVAKGSTNTLTATVASGSTSSTTVPTGTVSFTSSTQGLLGTATLNTAGIATLTPTYTTSGASTISATYSGDATYATAASTTPAAVTVSPAAGAVASTTTLTTSATSVTQGGTATLTATVASGSASSTTIPTGTVTFTSSTQGVLGTVTLNAAGVATLAPTFSIAGAATITATYSGDSTYAASSGGAALTVSGTIANGGLSMVINPTVTTYGTTVNLTATVIAAPTSGTTGPTGTVTFSLQPNAGGSALVYTATLSPINGTTGIASLSITTLAAGTYTVTATCAGTNFSCSGLQATGGIQIQKAPTKLGLTASPSQIVAGQPTLLTGTITLQSGANAPCTGVVSFFVANSLVANVPVAGNVANYTLTLPSGVSNSINAQYSGDQNCLQSTSATITIAAPTANTTISVFSSTQSVLVNGAITLTATVQSVPSVAIPNPGIPTGSVTFYDTLNGVQTSLGVAGVLQTGATTGTATITTTGLKAGTHVITAVYSGATGYAGSQSGTTLVAVQDFTLSFSPGTGSVAKGGTASALITVTPVTGFSGTVTFGCVAPANSASNCSISPGSLSGGSGTATLTIGTTAATRAVMGSLGRNWIEAVCVGGILLGMFAPARRRKWMAQLVVLVGLSGLGVAGLSGCTSTGTLGSSSGSGGGSGSGATGTPSGTLQYTITATGTDGRTSVTKTAYYSVTVQ